MLKVGNAHLILAYVAAGVSALSVILTAISRFAGQTLVITQGSYLNIAVIAILFAIYFLLAGAAHSAKKSG
ncbi:hypothetical protein ACFLVH_02435 [Chloroflexota bacterium]